MIPLEVKHPYSAPGQDDQRSVSCTRSYGDRHVKRLKEVSCSGNKQGGGVPLNILQHELMDC